MESFPRPVFAKATPGQVLGPAKPLGVAGKLESSASDSEHVSPLARRRGPLDSRFRGNDSFVDRTF
jgi:hypothetical protein